MINNFNKNQSFDLYTADATQLNRCFGNIDWVYELLNKIGILR